MISPAKTITSAVKPTIAAMIDQTLYEKCRYASAFSRSMRTSNLVQRPGDDKWDQAVKQRGEMVSVGEESDRLFRIGDFDRIVKHSVVLVQPAAIPGKRLRMPTVMMIRVRYTPFPIAQQQRAEKNGNGRDKRNRA